MHVPEKVSLGRLLGSLREREGGERESERERARERERERESVDVLACVV